MMDLLEGTTLDLIYRRRVTTLYPGYTIILIVLGIIVALPLVKVDVVSTSGGMIRPGHEPVDLFTSITGIVDSSLLLDHREVTGGDTLIWLRTALPDTRKGELLSQIERNRRHMEDIESILRGRNELQTNRYRQSLKNHTTACRRLILERDFLHDEFKAARILFEHKVIPLREFEHARSEYLVACAQIDDHQESYLNHLEDELNLLTLETRIKKGEIEEIEASLQNYHVIAPSSGTLCQCRGIMAGSVIHAGISLGSISPGGPLAADCYVETRDIKEIQKGMPVRIRMDGMSQQSIDHLETTVSQVDPDVIIMNGRPVYRVRCKISSTEGLIPGMTFSASMMLYRTSVASLLMKKINRHFSPSLAQDQRKKR